MGFSFKRMFHNPVSLLNPVAGGFRQLDPGPNGRDTPAPGYERRSADQVQWDPTTGMPIGAAGPPAHEVALQYQYRGQEWFRQRQQALWGDAQGALSAGTDLFQSYRPGGSAALASGIFGQRASLYGQQAMSLEEPDLMSAYREDKEIQAERAARRAARLQAITGIVGTIAGIAGGAVGAPGVGAAVAGGAGQAGQTGSSPYGPYANGYNMPPTAGAEMQASGAPGAAGQQPYQIMPPQGAPQGAGPGGTSNYGAAQSMPGGDGSPAGGGSAGGRGGPSGGGGSSGAMTQAGPGGGMVGGGLGSDGMLTGPSLVAAAMQDPMMSPIVMKSIASSEYYSTSTYIHLHAAAQRLQEAMSLA